MLAYLETILSILTGFLGIIVVFILLLSYKSNRYVNIYLIIVILIKSLRNFYFSLVSDSFKAVLMDDFSWLRSSFFIVIPCFYLYVKTIIDNNKHPEIKSILHFIYPILLCILALAQSYYNLIPEYSWILFIKINFIGSLLFYIVNATLLVQSFYKKRNEDLLKENNFKTTKNWIVFIYILFILILIRVIINFGIENELYVELFPILANLIFLVLYLKILVSPEILFGLTKLKHSLTKNLKEVVVHDTIWDLKLPSITNVQDLKLKPLIQDKITSHIYDMEQLLQKRYLFRNLKYTLSNLAKDMNIPLSHLSYLFKYHSNLSFVEFKNHCRVLDAIFLMETNFLDSKTLDALSIHVGFVTYNSFFIAFKKQTGYAPNDYLVSAKNITLSY
jgi:AraC-like DNA-binding protein